MKRYSIDRAELSHLFAWEIIASSSDCEKIYEEELLLAKYHFRTRVKHSDGLCDLSVPEKEAEVAKALLSGDVTDVIDEPKQTYHVFNDDLTRKHTYKPRLTYGLSRAQLRAQYYMMMGFLILVLLLIFHFMGKLN